MTALKKVVTGIIFDLDGTLVDVEISFTELRRRLGLPPTGDILGYVNSLPEPERSEAYSIIDELEDAGVEGSRPVAGMERLLSYLEEQELPFAVVTRASGYRAREVMEKHGIPCQILVAREDCQPKPSPEPVHLAARGLGLKPESMVMVGDFLYDIQSGNRAGCQTVLLKRPGRRPFKNTADFTIEKLDELINILQKPGGEQ